MPRVKRGVTAHKKRERLLKHTKGFRWGRKSKERAAKEALLHAWSHAYRGRKEKKRNFRTLWQVQLNAALRANGTTYGRFMHTLRTHNVALNRKMLADIAEHDENAFKAIVAEAMKR